MLSHGASIAAQLVIAVLILVLLAVPTVAWVIFRAGPKFPRQKGDPVPRGTKHRWWQP